MSEEEPTNKSELARALAAQRRIVEGNCAACGKPFRATVRRKFCSNACAQRDYYARHKGGPVRPRRRPEPKEETKA